jgi:Na+-transporting NADH:ubiquinone oxidoreductase subunit NqrF
LQKISVIGKASGNTTILDVKPLHMKMTVLDYLTNYEIPVASSCRGNGICHKCKINKNLLACELTVEKYICDIGLTIEIDYI